MYSSTGGGYMSGGLDHSESVKLCMKVTQTDDNGPIYRYNRNKSSSFSLPKPNIPFAKRSTSGFLGFGPFEPNKSPGIPSYCSLRDPYLDDYFSRKFGRMLSPHMPLRDSYHASLDVEKMGLRADSAGSFRLIRSQHHSYGEVVYKVAVTTADVKGAGTSVPIFVSIRGQRGNLPRTRLKKPGKQKKTARHENASAGRKASSSRSEGFRFNPGSTNFFPVRCQDLGDIESIVIEHEGLDPKDSWLLQGVEIMNVDSKRIWMFVCNHWLSLYKEDGRISRELFAFKSMRTKYEIVTVTGDLPDAGTDSRVFISLIGRTGVSPQIELQQHRDNRSSGSSKSSYFQRGQSAKFVVAASCVGPLTMVRVRQDESGISSKSWFLERICITDLKHPEWRYYFSLKNWLSRSHSDGAVVREIRGSKEITGIATRTKYKISLYTAAKPGAGTRARVYLQLIGREGESDLIALTQSSGGFEEGSIVEQVESMRQLGPLKKVKIGHDNTGPAPKWLLDKVIVNDMDLSRVYEFPCGLWFSDEVGESLVRELTVKQNPFGDSSKMQYELRLTTGSRNKADTSSKVYVMMAGPERQEEEQDGGGRRSQKRQRRSEEETVLSSGRIWVQGAQFARDRTDVVKIELAQMLSPLTELRVGISPSGKKADWFLDDVVVFCPNTGVEQSFICGNWLSNEREGCDTEVVLVEDMGKRKKKQSKEPWRIVVYTSSEKEAGTAAKVTAVLYGLEKKGDDVLLPLENGEKFKKGSAKEFEIQIVPVGVPLKLRLQHDNSGSSAAWLVDKVVMRRMATDDEYVFQCGRWLSMSHDDHSLARELPAEGPGILKVAEVHLYRVQIYTGTKQYAGTDAQVFITVFGTVSDSGDRNLTHSLTNSNKFEKGKMDEFMLEAVELGQIYKIRLGHDGKLAGSGWYVEKVVVTQDDDPANSMTFRCQCWFDTQEGDGLIVRELTGAAMLGQVSYEVLVKTGTDAGAGTDANVFLRIFGSRGDTGELQLKTSDSAINKFEAGNIDTFKIEAEDIGKVQSIRLSQDGSGAGAAWLVDSLTILVRDEGLRYVFMLNKWLDKRQMFIEADPTSEEKIDKTVPYQVTVFTGNVHYAGTDAKVFLQIYGRDKKTEELPLVNRTNNFESGAEDIFKLNATDVERIQKIRIGHDGRKPGAGWFLDRVLIEKLVNPKTEEEAAAKNKLLKRQRSEQSLGSMVSFDSDVVVPRKSVSIRPGVEEDMELYWFFCGRWLAADEDDGMIVRELLPMDENGQPLSDLREMEYTVDVKTGTVSGAGTDANVFLTIFGNKGDSGERSLKNTVDKTVNKFEDNSLDRFLVKAIDLGCVERIKIRHDNAGGGAAWYLDYVLIVDDVGNEYLFPSYNWLARNEGDGQIAREIFSATPDVLAQWRQNKLSDASFRIHQEDQLEKYLISVFTSKKRMGGTDANVDIVLFGDNNDSGVIPLKTSLTHSNKFESGNVDKFEIKSSGLENLKKIKIRHDGSGGNSDWHLEKVEVEATKLGRSWVFPCNEWISKTRGEAKLERELYPAEGLTQIGRSKVTYEVAAYTSDRSGASTSANVYIQIYGRNDCTEQKVLASPIDKSGKYKRGAKDTFYMELEDIEEPLQKIRIGHDGAGIGAGWHLEKVTVKRLNEGGRKAVTYVFPCNRWLAKDEDDRAIERELLPDKIIRVDDEGEVEEEFGGLVQKKNYLVKVHTGSESGTNCNVFLKVYGENGDTGERQLSHSETYMDKFEKNHVDEFKWEAVDIGRVFRIDIRHDNSGLFKKDWFLKKLDVVDQLDGETYSFYCEKWLSKSKEDKKIKRTFYVAGYTGDKAATSIGRTRSVNSDSLSIGGDTESGFKKQFAVDDEDEVDYKLDMVPYTITVVTGPKANMGSSGPIWVRFHGSSNRKTQRLRLQKQENEYFAPDSRETFSIEAADIDHIKQIEVCNDGVDERSSWFLASIAVEIPTRGRRYQLDCGTWLSRFEGERQSSRLLAVQDRMMTKFSPKVTYSLTFITGEVDSAGTSSSLFIQLFGTEGSSSLYPIEKLEERFERGGRDEIKMEMENVGIIKRVRLQNDGLGQRPHWYLEKLDITNEKTYEVYEFEYNDYLSSTLGQKKQLTVDLATSQDTKKTTYQIKVKTSDEKGASASGAVFLKLFGEYGDSGDLNLKSLQKGPATKPFQRNQADEFELPNVLSLGELARCQVWLCKEGLLGGPGQWHLESLEVREPGAKKMWHFPGGKWLSLSEGDRQICRDLICDRTTGPSTIGKKPRQSVFEVTVVTGDKKGAGMQHNVWFRFHGPTSFSDIYKMNNTGATEKFFSRGATDTVKAAVEYIGELRELMLGATVSRSAISSASDESRRWYCHEVRVKDTLTLKTYVFEVREWVKVTDRQDEDQALLLLPKAVLEDPAKKRLEDIKKAGLVNYEVLVVTGDVLGAGTNANVALTLFGENSDSGKRPLMQKGRDLFERKQEDRFLLECIDLGALKNVKIEHDNAGWSSDWLLDHLIITNQSNNMATRFDCRAWLSKDKGDRTLWKMLTPTTA